MNLRLKEFRKKTHLSQSELAKVLEVDTKTVGNWERGKTSMTAEQLWDCCVAFETDPNTMLGWDESRFDDPRTEELIGCWNVLGEARKASVLQTARDAALAEGRDAQRNPLQDREPI